MVLLQLKRRAIIGSLCPSDRDIEYCMAMAAMVVQLLVPRTVSWSIVGH